MKTRLPFFGVSRIRRGRVGRGRNYPGKNSDVVRFACMVNVLEREKFKHYMRNQKYRRASCVPVRTVGLLLR